MKMNVRDLQELIAENAKHRREQFDSLTQKYLQLCKEFLLKNSAKEEIYSSAFIGIPIKSVDIKFGEILTVENDFNSIYYLDEDDSFDDFCTLMSFEDFDDDLYGGEIEYYEIIPFVKALEGVGFKVFIDDININNVSEYALIPFFENNLK